MPSAAAQLACAAVWVRGSATAACRRGSAIAPCNRGSAAVACSRGSAADACSRGSAGAASFFSQPENGSAGGVYANGSGVGAGPATPPTSSPPVVSSEGASSVSSPEVLSRLEACAAYSPGSRASRSLACR
eukprot:scaffold135307_cov69-Phaeocystis_antarctica.AAC.3